ncbi:MAG: YqaJ viral recombinase family protein, partial [Endomicrobium sp.]|nr:YqaJ viral recombinase family protein [Endomicrobium sp.]
MNEDFIKKILNRTVQTSSIVGDFTAPVEFLTPTAKKKYYDVESGCIKDSEAFFTYTREKGMNESIDVAIGGSDAPVVMGTNSYKSEYELWQEKRGVFLGNPVKRFISNETQKIFDIGHAAEPILRAMFSAYTG